VKVLYSPKGLYVLFDAGDKKLTAKIEKDFENLWEEDVFEVFLWTDEKHATYFEYEISPLNVELPILVPNFDDKFLGWLPWHYEGGAQNAKGHSRSGRKEDFRRRNNRLVCRSFSAVRIAFAAAERAPQTGNAVASQLLPHGLRRRQNHPLDLGPRRPEFS